MQNHRLQALLIATLLASSTALAQTAPPSSPPATRKVAPDRIECIVNLAVSAKVGQTEQSYGKGSATRHVTIVSLRSRIIAIRSKDPGQKDGCTPAEKLSADEENLPILFDPKQLAELKVPSTMEVLYVQMQAGFAYYGLPNSSFFVYSKTLP